MKESFSINQSPNPLEIFFVGDCHCIPFRNLLFSSENWTGLPIATRASYLGGVQAANIFVGNKLRPDIFQALRMFGLITKYGDISHFSIDKSIPKRPIRRFAHRIPNLVFTVGDIDIRHRLLRQLGDNIDFSIPSVPETSWLNSVDRDKFISIQIVKKLIRDSYDPLVKALAYLTKLGFTRTYLHCLPPPTIDDKKFKEINEYSFPRKLHYKVVYLVNQFLKEECAKHRVGFIDIWSSVTKNDLLLDDYYFDHTRLNEKAWLHTIEFLLKDIYDNPDPRALDQQYIDLYSATKEELQKSVPADTSFNRAQFDDFAKQSLYCAKGLIDEKLTSQIKSSLEFNKDIEYFMPNYDWVGGRGKHPDVHNKTSRFSQESLKLIFRALYDEKPYSLIKSMLGSNFVTFVRCRKSVPHEEVAVGSQAFHRDGNPPGILRGLLYLSDVTPDSGPFEVLLNPKKKAVTQVIGPAGSLLIFDAQRYLHRGLPPQKVPRYALDIVFIPCSINTQPFVAHQCINSWPYDPYKFDVSKFPSYPIINQKTINLSKPVALQPD